MNRVPRKPVSPRHPGEFHYHPPTPIRSAVFGFNDGLVSAIALAAGLVAAGIQSGIIVLAVSANAVAGIISMSLGDYLGTKSQLEYFKSEEDREKREMREMPDEEKREVEDIFKAWGFTGKLLRQSVDRVVSQPRVWLQVMMSEELGIPKAEVEDPKKAAMFMGVSYAIGSLIPLVPFVFLAAAPGMAVASALSIIALFGVGYLKCRFTHRNPVKSGIETLAIGVFASIAAYAAGAFVSSIIPGA